MVQTHPMKNLRIITALGTFPKDLTKKVKAVNGTCMLVDGTKAIQNLHELRKLGKPASGRAGESSPDRV